MAGVRVKGSPKSVAAPAAAKFLHGTWPPEPKMAPAPRIKPGTGVDTRNYGKQLPLAGDTGMTGQS